MPHIDLTAPTREDILAFQREYRISDRELGLAIIGDVSDPGAVVRAWKSSAKEPTLSNLLAFRYLRALVKIVDLSPEYPEDMFGLAHSALPQSMQ